MPHDIVFAFLFVLMNFWSCGLAEYARAVAGTVAIGARRRIALEATVIDSSYAWNWFKMRYDGHMPWALCDFVVVRDEAWSGHCQFDTIRWLGNKTLIRQFILNLNCPLNISRIAHRCIPSEVWTEWGNDWSRSIDDTPFLFCFRWPKTTTNDQRWSMVYR